MGASIVPARLAEVRFTTFSASDSLLAPKSDDSESEAILRWRFFGTVVLVFDFLDSSDFLSDAVDLT